MLPTIGETKSDNVEWHLEDKQYIFLYWALVLAPLTDLPETYIFTKQEVSDFSVISMYWPSYLSHYTRSGHMINVVAYSKNLSVECARVGTYIRAVVTSVTLGREKPGA